MAELVSREKEFLKLNEQLDKIAAETNTDSTKIAPTKRSVESRFNTYTKPHTLVKRRGAGGDGPPKTGTTTDTTSQKKVSAARSPRAAVIAKPMQVSNSNELMVTVRITEAAEGSYSHRSNKSNKNEKPTGNEQQAPAPITKPQIECAGGVCTFPRPRVPKPNNLLRTNRTYNQRVASNQTFTVRYKNPNFISSPSLKDLAKGECAAFHNCREEEECNENVVQNTISMLEHEVHQEHKDCSHKKHLSTDGLIKFLKTKMHILEEEHDHLTLEMAKQKDMVNKTLERIKISEQQRDQAIARNNALSEQVKKSESQLDEANHRLKERLLGQSQYQKELDAAKRELKLLSQTNASLEKRLYRTNEDLENTKSALQNMKISERDAHKANRLELENKDKLIKSLKKQRSDLLNAYKKQLFLISNLKQQNACLEQSRMSFISEKEFTKVLEWNSNTHT